MVRGSGVYRGWGQMEGGGWGKPERWQWSESFPCVTFIPCSAHSVVIDLLNMLVEIKVK